MRFVFAIALLLVLLAESIAFAEAPFIERDIRKWKVSIAPGYGMLYVNGEDGIRHGFGGRLEGSYAFTPNWDLKFTSSLGFFNGDAKGLEGLYSQISVLAGARYNFTVKDWFEPYILFGLGYIRTEYDFETYTVFVTHSMMIEGGLGMGFRILPNFWLGAEATIAPIFFGHYAISNSLYLHTMLTAELRL